MKSFPLRILCGLQIILLINGLSSCSSEESVLQGASAEEKAELAQLMSLLEEKTEENSDDTEKIFILWEKIITLYLDYGQSRELLTLLGNYVQKHPEDPFNGYYLYTMAQEHRRQGHNAPAAQYLTILLNNHSEVEACCVTGSGNPQPYALILPAEELRPKLREPAERERFEGELTTLFHSVNKEVEAFERLQFLVVVKDPWVIENGFLTPTMKIKRSKIEDTYGPMSEAWYAAGKRIIWEA